MAEFLIKINRTYNRMIHPKRYRFCYRPGDAVICQNNNFTWGNAEDWRATDGAAWDGTTAVLRVRGMNLAEGRQYTAANDRGIPALFSDDEFYVLDKADRRRCRHRRMRYRIDLSQHPDLLVPPHFMAVNGNPFRLLL